VRTDRIALGHRHEEAAEGRRDTRVGVVERIAPGEVGEVAASRRLGRRCAQAEPFDQVSDEPVTASR
jgi:hypothetical protein